MSKLHVGLALCVSLAAAAACAAQQPASSGAAAHDAASDASVAGKYEFAFTPENGETVTGQLVISLKAGRYYGVLTSPKLDEPLDADSVHVDGAHVFTSSFGGQFTFAFDVHGNTIANAVFTKSLRGMTEQGALGIKKVRP